MATTIRTAGALMLAVVLVFCGAGAAQEVETDAVDDAEVRLLAQLPVAVARALEAGASPDEVSALMRELRLARAPTADVIEILRVVPAARDTRFPTRLDGPDAVGTRLSERAAFFRIQGLHGAALAREIRSELRAQGIPVGDALAQRGPPPISRAFIPEGARVDVPGRSEGPDRGPRRGSTGDDGPPARAGEPPRGPPVGAERERRPGERSPEVGETPGQPLLDAESPPDPSAESGRSRAAPPRTP